MAGAVKPGRPSHERDQILHFYETLNTMLASLATAQTSEPQRRKNLQRIYLWYSTSKHQLPVTLLRRIAQPTRHETAARRASLVGSSTVASSGSFAVGYLATSTGGGSQTVNNDGGDGEHGDNDELRDILGNPLDDSTLVTVQGTELSDLPVEFLEGLEVETVSTIHSAADFKRVFGSRKARRSKLLNRAQSAPAGVRLNGPTLSAPPAPSSTQPYANHHHTYTTNSHNSTTDNHAFAQDGYGSGSGFADDWHSGQQSAMQQAADDRDAILESMTLPEEEYIYRINRKSPNKVDPLRQATGSATLVTSPGGGYFPLPRPRSAWDGSSGSASHHSPAHRTQPPHAYANDPGMAQYLSTFATQLVGADGDRDGTAAHAGGGGSGGTAGGGNHSGGHAAEFSTTKTDLEIPAEAQPYDMHFRRMVPKVPGAARPSSAAAATAAGTTMDPVAMDQMRYRWRHDGHHGATYYKPMVAPTSAKSVHIMDESEMGLIGPKAPLYEGGRAAMLRAMMPERYDLKGIGPRMSLLGDGRPKKTGKTEKKQKKKKIDLDDGLGVNFMMRGTATAATANWGAATKKVSMVGGIVRRFSSIHLGAQSLAMTDGWGTAKGQAPTLDVLQTQPAENVGQAMRKLRKGYDIEGSGMKHKGKSVKGGFFKPKKDPLAAHRLFAKKVRERLQKSGIKCKDKRFDLADLEQFNKRKLVISKAREHFHVGEPCSHEELLEAMKALGHPLMMDELHEALTACTPPRHTAKVDDDAHEWKVLKEKVMEDGLDEMDFLKIVCHFEPPCGVKLLQDRLVSSSWLMPRVSGVDATKYVTDSGITFTGFDLGGDGSGDGEDGGGDGSGGDVDTTVAGKLGAGADGHHGNDSAPGSPTTQEEEHKRTLAVAAATAAIVANT